MRALVQRVLEGRVVIDGRDHARIGRGYVVLLGVRKGDADANAAALAGKCAALRVMEDSNGKMNLSLHDAAGDLLVVPQFTLYGDASRGHRPSFTDAAPPEEAERLYEVFVRECRKALGETRVQTGVFGAMMQVHIVNEGPVTILIESPDKAIS